MRKCDENIVSLLSENLEGMNLDLVMKKLKTCDFSSFIICKAIYYLTKSIFNNHIFLVNIVTYSFLWHRKVHRCS